MKTPKVATVVTKRALIDKANSTTLVAAGIAAFLVVFSAVSANALVSQLKYQQRVIKEKKATLKQVRANLEARDSLVEAYGVFIGAPTNIIGGSSGGTSDRDGDNEQIVLDALPDRYDFPALAASIEKLANSQNLALVGIGGTDEGSPTQEAAATPEAAPVTFEVSVSGGYVQIQGIIKTFEQSIRPIQITALNIDGGNEGLSADISAQTFYQAEKKLELGKKVVK